MSSSVRFLLPRGGVMALALAIVLTVYLTLQEQDIRQVAKGKGGNKPNIIVIMTDDQRADTLAYMPTVRNQLGEKGVIFTNMIAATPLCCPSRSSFLTGQYAYHHSVWSNNPPLGGFKKFKDKSTIGVWMHRAGYRTGFIGKYLNGYVKDKYIPPGWDEWYGRAHNTYFGYTLNENGSFVEYGYKEKDYSTDVYKDIAINFIKGIKQSPDKENDKKDKNKDSHSKNGEKKPFFLVVAVDAPHTDGGKSEADAEASSVSAAATDQEAQIKARYAQRNDQNIREDDDKEGEITAAGNNNEVVKDYYAMPAPRHKPCEKLPSYEASSLNEEDTSDKPEYIRSIRKWTKNDIQKIERFRESQVCSLKAVDEAVGHILKSLGPERDNTVVIFVSDNGYSWGDHRWDTKNCEYEVCIKVPLIISYPKMVKNSAVSTAFAQIEDLAPTIADLGGAKIPNDVDGKSLVPLLQNPKKSVRTAALIDIYQSYSASKIKALDYGIRTDGYKYVVSATCELQLYDLKKDPYELENQIKNSSFQGTITKLSTELDKLMQGKRKHQCKNKNNKDKKPAKEKNPSPSETTTPSPSVTESPEPSETQSPTDGTPTPQGRTMTFSLTALLHGIGASGDSVNPAGRGNPSPTTTSKPFTAQIFSDDELVAESQGTVSYNKTKGNFSGNFTAHNIPPGTLQIIIKIPKYLSTEVKGQGVGKNTITLPVLTFITGDVNNDDALDILDYNILTDCFDRTVHVEVCEKDMQQISDLDENRTVDEPDINLFLRELKGRNEF